MERTVQARWFLLDQRLVGWVAAVCCVSLPPPLSTANESLRVLVFLGIALEKIDWLGVDGSAARRGRRRSYCGRLSSKRRLGRMTTGGTREARPETAL